MLDVKTLCLGVLTRGDMTGYQIKKHFEEAFSHFFVAGFGSIYPALGDLAQAGLVTCHDVEQTGRIDAGIDHRTDLYLLGVLFYEMLTGKPPFETLDPLELIHAHLARLPTPPGAVDSTIPGPLSEIVMRLLMKKPDERYKSAHGVLADLRECEALYRNTGTISSFTLGLYDRPENFEIPDKLYGRKDELKRLIEVFDQVHQGGSKLLLVAGYSGVGKTSLIQHIKGSVVEKKAYFVSGKYDQPHT